MNLADAFSWVVLAAGIAALVAYLAFVVFAVIQIVRSTIFEVLIKALWMLAIVAFPLFGTMAWYLFGHRTGEVERRLGLNHAF